jgi:putative transposase
MGRGLDCQFLFHDDDDRGDVVRRLATLAEAAAFTVYAWALLPIHFHLLVRMGARPLARSMRPLVTGYAGAFNRRHERKEHLFGTVASPTPLRRSRIP